MKYKWLLFFIVVNFIVLHAAVKETKKGIEFSYDAPNAAEVSVAGSFNDWNASATQLKQDSEGVWSTIIKLSPGSYQYKFVVDGTWYFDPDNPLSEDDSYGGANSLIEIDKNGKMMMDLKDKTERTGIQATFNPKIYFTGRYYTQNYFRNNDYDRYMLDKPEHDLNLGIKVKFNSNFEGFTLLNVNNNNEGTDMWKTHLNYKKAYLKLNTDYFMVTAFDDLGLVTFDDPLHIVGNEGRYKYDFGYGYRGVYGSDMASFLNNLFMKIPIQFHLQGFYADELGDAERDINAGRMKASYSLANDDQKAMDFTLGGSLYQSKNKFTESYSILEIIENPSHTLRFYQDHTSYELDLGFQYSMMKKGWFDSMDYLTDFEWYHFDNANKFQLFESDTTLDSLVIKDDYTWLSGDKFYFREQIKFPKALKISADVELTNLEFSVYQPTGDDDVTQQPYFDPNFTNVEMKRTRLGTTADYEMDNLNTSLSLSYWTIDFPDSLVTWGDYYKYMEKTDGNGRWYQEHTEVPLSKYTLIGYDSGLLWNFKWDYSFNFWEKMIKVGTEHTFAHSDFMTEYKYIENLMLITIQLSHKWQLYSNTRIPIYNDERLGLKTKFGDNEDVFVSNYSEISYQLSKKVELALGWGLNPRVLNQVTDEFYFGGREEFMENSSNYDEYIEKTQNGLGDKIREAENALKHEQRISLQAILHF